MRTGVLQNRKYQAEKRIVENYLASGLPLSDVLIKRQEKIIRLRYGLDSLEPLSLDEIANHYKGWTSSICKTIKRSLRSLKHPETAISPAISKTAVKKHYRKYLKEKMILDNFLQSGHSLDSILTPKQEKIIRLRFAVDRPDPLAIKEIANKFHITVPVVRKIIRFGFRSLRNPEIPFKTTEKSKSFKIGKVIIERFFQKGYSLSGILNKREEKIIRLRYGLDSGKPLTFKDIGKIVHLPDRRVLATIIRCLRQIENPDLPYKLCFRTKAYQDGKKVVENYLQSGHPLSNILNKREEKILRLRYGLDTGKPSSYNSIAKQFKRTNAAIRSSIIRILRQLKNPEIPLTRDNQKKWVREEGKRIIESYLQTGRALSEILNERDEKILRLKFGMDNRKPLTNMGIGNLFHISRTNVISSVQRSLWRLQNPDTLPKTFEQSKGYLEGKKIVDDYLQSGHNLSEVLNEEEKNIVRLRYGLDTGKPLPQTRIAQQVQIHKGSIPYILFRSLRQLKNPGIPATRAFRNRWAQEEAKKIINSFLQTGRTLSEVVNKRDEQIIRLRFGLDTGEILSLKEIGNKFKIPDNTVSEIITRNLWRLKHPEKVFSMPERNKFFQEQKKFLEEYLKPGRSLSNILKPRQVKILQLRFGLDGKKPLAQKTIAGIYKVARGTIGKVIRVSLEKLNYQSTIKLREKANPLYRNGKKVIEHFLQTGLSLSDILNKKQERFIKLRYGLDWRRPLTLSEISEICEISTENIYSSVVASLQKLKRYGYINTSELTAKFDREGKEIVDKYLKSGHPLSKVLTDRQEKIIRLHYGLDSKEPRSLQYIASLYQISKSTVCDFLVTGLRKLKYPDEAGENILLNKTYQKGKKILEIYLKTGRPLSDVLNDREKRVIQLRFGLDSGKPMVLKQIASKFRVSPSNVSYLINHSIQKLKSEFSTLAMK